MNVYDFDGTIYDGDSTADFILRCISQKPLIGFKVAKDSLSYVSYKASLCSKTDFKEKLYSYLSCFPRIDELVEKFWDKNIKHVKSWYYKQKRDDDVIISASPEFLLKPVCERLGIKHLLASKVDTDTGMYLGINCFGAEKVRRFYEAFGTDACIEKFFSDSKSDEPLASIAESAYMVKGDNITDWDF